MTRSNRDSFLGFFIFLAAIAAMTVVGVYLATHGHWEETGNIVPASDSFMFVKSGDAMIPIPVHYPAHPEKRWVWNK